MATNNQTAQKDATSAAVHNHISIADNSGFVNIQYTFDRKSKGILHEAMGESSTYAKPDNPREKDCFSLEGTKAKILDLLDDKLCSNITWGMRYHLDDAGMLVLMKDLVRLRQARIDFYRNPNSISTNNYYISMRDTIELIQAHIFPEADTDRLTEMLRAP